MTKVLIIATIGLPWLGGLAVWSAGDGRPRAQHFLAVLFSAAAGLAALALLPGTGDTAVINMPVGRFFGSLTFVPDGLGVFLAIVATVVGSLTVLFSVDYMSGKAQLGRYYTLILYFIGAMAALALTGSLFFLFIFWEITAFCSYALISFNNDDPRAVRGGIKALLLTQFGGVGLLIGALVAFAYLGDFQIDTFLARASELPPNLLAVLAFGCIAAAAAKSAQVPFHSWLPDAMEAPTPVSALIHAATMVNAGVYLLARFYPAFADVKGWSTAVILIGLLSAALAALMALYCSDLKRVLAYSTISQLGYMVYAVGIGAILASQFHLLSHAVFKALLFLGAGAVIHELGTRDMNQMGGLRRQMPFVCLVFIIGSLALVGLPLANGFFSKEWILESGLTHGPLWAYTAMLAGVGLTAAYTFRMVRMVFFGEADETRSVHDAPRAMRISLLLLAIATLTTWLLAGPFTAMLGNTLPFHHLIGQQTGELAREIVTAPATWLTMVIVLTSAGLWLVNAKLSRPSGVTRTMAALTAADLGFEWLNRQVVKASQMTSSALSRTQTGQLNWNVAGIVIGLVIVLIVLSWGV